MSIAMNNQDWIDDCMKYWGRVLTGKHSHWCLEFDDLPIDETCKMEYDCCLCFPIEERIKNDHEENTTPTDETDTDEISF